MENRIICNCKQVSYFDIMNALDKTKKFDDALDAFRDVQAITNCTTGCGGCYDKILDAISEIMA